MWNTSFELSFSSIFVNRSLATFFFCIRRIDCNHLWLLHVKELQIFKWWAKKIRFYSARVKTNTIKVIISLLLDLNILLIVHRFEYT